MGKKRISFSGYFCSPFFINYNGNTFEYDARGRRISKQKTGETKITFTYDSNGNLIKQSNGLEFFYDHTGVFAVKYNGSTYFYRKNAQNDIISLLDNSGAVVVKYRYDAWGKCVVDTSTTNTELANINPFRYRSYYLDTETELYYLQSRYYDPEVGRFINADASIILMLRRFDELNSFVYCTNDSTNKCDSLGFASYKNTKSKITNGVYNITSIIMGWGTKLTYKYQVDNGVIRFAFENNNYWSVLWRGWAKTLAQAMYKITKSIKSSYLKGRTITGIHVELFIHWALYKVGIKKSSTRQADMGGCWGLGYDSNAWVFESFNIISKALKININAIWAYISFLRDLSHYF